VHFSPHVLSPLGLLACAAATAVSIRLSWLAICRYYLTCDLSRPDN